MEQIFWYIYVHVKNYYKTWHVKHLIVFIAVLVLIFYKNNFANNYIKAVSLCSHIQSTSVNSYIKWMGGL